MHAGAVVDASGFDQASLAVALPGAGVLVLAFHLASPHAFDPSLFGHRPGGSRSGVRGAFHPLDRLGEELLLADLPRFGVLGLVLEPVEDLLRRAARVSRSGDLSPQLRGLHRVMHAAHDEPCLLTSAGGASGTGNIAPAFATTPLTRITPEAVRLWHSELTSRAGALQAAKGYRLLRAVLNTAVADGLFLRNPCRIVGGGQEYTPERPLVTPEQVLALAEAIEPRYQALVLLAGTGGLRLGELLGLRRNYVDTATAIVRIEEQATHLMSGEHIVGPPKSAAGKRTVVLPAITVEALNAHLDQYVGAGDDALVFTDPSGQPLHKDVLYKAWRPARAAVGLEHATIHDLRHAGATLAAWTGASTKELMARLGHASPRAALRYQHAAESRDREIAARLDDLGL